LNIVETSLLLVLLPIARRADSVDNEGMSGLVGTLLGQRSMPGADL
jgi:hypothetical protein